VALCELHCKEGGSMKNCTDCKYAIWKRNVSGNLHPSGDGDCMFPWKMPPLPACKYWIGSSEPRPYGGSINRRDELPTHCTYYEKAGV
jgi:hypothetical protein